MRLRQERLLVLKTERANVRGIKDRLCSLAALRGTHHHGNGCAQQLFIQAKSALVLAVPVQKNRQGVQVQLVERQTCGRSEPEPDTGFDPLQIGKIQHCFIASKILRLFEFQRPQRHGVRGAELAGGLVLALGETHPTDSRLRFVTTRQFGWTRPEEVRSPELARVLFELPVGQISPVIEVGDQVFICRVLEKFPAPSVPVEDLPRKSK